MSEGRPPPKKPRGPLFGRPPGTLRVSLGNPVKDHREGSARPYGEGGIQRVRKYFGPPATGVT